MSERRPAQYAQHALGLVGQPVAEPQTVQQSVKDLGVVLRDGEHMVHRDQALRHSLTEQGECIQGLTVDVEVAERLRVPR
ncbi:hypothetical protein [Streptomyces sp. SAJ15]|uniref:hypothetical protein n=1 Tax=Streptomyces sp. SAJ15 TaxID=2011095 RepID=UPI0011853F45|nr:hypothetical protein [Streptomyces sp. SAJ15]TVL87434.1 hypothetical protein CD790_33485 [Streptomyces sp. SAJ15]